MPFGRRAYGCWAILLLVLVTTSGCENVRPIYHVENQPIPQLSTPLTLKQIEKHIITAGRIKNWTLRVMGPGKIQGLLTIRSRSAVVTINYDERFYSIRYKSSHRLYARKALEDRAFEGQFVIHRKYNSRVRALERSINRELSFPSR